MWIIANDLKHRRAPDEERDRVMVAAPRPWTHAPAPRSHGRAAAASDAGLVLVAIIVAFAALGVVSGAAVGARVAGGLVGGFVGVAAGFAAIYRRFREL
jgi:hypothetical protein